MNIGLNKTAVRDPATARLVSHSGNLRVFDSGGAPISNGVTRAGTGTNSVPFASFSLASAVPAVVSRSTNEVWRWSATVVDGHPFAAPVSVATNGPGVAYSILDEPQFPWTDSSVTDRNVWISELDFLMTDKSDFKAGMIADAYIYPHVIENK